MSDCKTCKYHNDGCYCPTDKYCRAYEKKKVYIKHTYEFMTEEDWKPMTSACWIDCPFSFMIGLSQRCKCVDDKFKIECPFVGNCVR